MLDQEAAHGLGQERHQPPKAQSEGQAGSAGEDGSVTAGKSKTEHHSGYAIVTLGGLVDLNHFTANKLSPPIF